MTDSPSLSHRRFSLFSARKQKDVGADENDAGLERQTTNIQQNRSQAWRLQLPKDLEHPLSIKRSFHVNSRRRVTLCNIYTSRDEDVLQDNQHGEFGDGDQILSSPGSLSPMSTSPDGPHLADDIHCYENSIQDDRVYNDERFVTAFGQKGRQVGEFEDAKDVYCLADSQILITDMVVGRLQKFSKSGNTVTVIAPNEITNPWSAVTTNSGQIVVTLCKEHCAKVLSENGDLVRIIGESLLKCPTGVACDSRGRIIICDASSDAVLIFDVDGKFIKQLGDPNNPDQRFSRPRYVCVSPKDDIIISDSGNHRVKVFNFKDEFVRSFGSFGRGNGQFKTPYGVCTNNYGEIFVADHYNSRICMFSRDGVFIRNIVTNDHGLLHPQGLRIDQTLSMYITHGHLKATEVLVFKLSANRAVSPYNTTHYIEMISHV